TAAQITQTFAAAALTIEPAQAERLALQLRNCDGDLNRLLGELGAAFCNDQADADRVIALRYASALKAADESLDERAARMDLKAAELDRKAEDELAEAAQDD